MPAWIVELFWNCLALALLAATACFIIAIVETVFKILEQWKGYK